MLMGDPTISTPRISQPNLEICVRSLHSVTNLQINQYLQNLIHSDQSNLKPRNSRPRLSRISGIPTNSFLKSVKEDYKLVLSKTLRIGDT